jgi:hypothetical protein
MLCDGHWTDSISVWCQVMGGELLLPAHCAFTEEERAMRFFVVGFLACGLNSRLNWFCLLGR